jgi:MoxR-like ATPase
VQRIRSTEDIRKPPGVAETLDWARALQALGHTDLDLASAAATLGAVLKYREDADRVRDRLDAMLAG